MSKLSREAAASVLEDRVTKIVKAMQVLIKDAPKIADVLDEEARLKTEAFLQSHFQLMMRELALAADFRPARTSFSLDAPLPAAPQRLKYLDGHPSAPVVKEVLIAAPQPSVPQPVEGRQPWRKPSGRLVGTKEAVYEKPERPRGAGDEITEIPDPKHGGIVDAGFIDA